MFVVLLALGRISLCRNTGAPRRHGRSPTTRLLYAREGEIILLVRTFLGELKSSDWGLSSKVSAFSWCPNRGGVPHTIQHGAHAKLRRVLCFGPSFLAPWNQRSTLDMRHDDDRTLSRVALSGEEGSGRCWNISQRGRISPPGPDLGFFLKLSRDPVEKQPLNGERIRGDSAPEPGGRRGPD